MNSATQFFNLGENNTNILINFLQDALAKNNEFEIRFGKFYQDKNINKTSFDSNVDIEFFHTLKKRFDTQIDNTKIFIKNTKETIYKTQNGKGNIKQIIDLSDNSESVMIKNTIKKYDIYDYDLRYSVAYEKMQDAKQYNFDLDNYEIIRYKHRVSYKLPFGHLDLTIVNQEMQDKSYTRKYEIELEITENQIELIIQYIALINQIRQNNFYVIPGLEKRNVINEYKNITNVNYFIGAQPESLCKDKISNLYKYEYSVTDKADGDRVFLLIDKTGNVYFIDNNINKIYKTDIKSTSGTLPIRQGKCILDGELVRVDNKIYFLAFDICYYNDNDLRGNNEYTLKKRLEIIKSLLKTFNNSDFYNIKCKEYYFGNVFSASKQILSSINEKIYKNDGLIFTPVNEPYPKTKKWSSLLKWKPAELNTIDFFAIKVGSKDNIGKWQLYVQGTLPANADRVSGQGTQPVLFDIEKLCGTNEQKVVTYETTFPDDLFDEITNMYYSSHTVIEFRWDSNDKKFVPLRTRWDKTANPKKHGNFSKVACDIWNNIHNPIDKDFLLQFYSSKTNDKSSDIYFERMRRFHNKVKEQLYSKYCKNSNYLLELCSGKGGDMHKWIFNNIKNIDGYDISDRNINECKRRFESLQQKKELNYNFYNLDLTKDNAYDKIYKNNTNGFDVVCCQFGFHYFFECKDHFDNITRILDTSLQIGGYFIITFLDDTKINKLFDGKKLCSREKDGEIIYILEKDNNDTEKIYGNRLKISLNGNNILGEGSDEWIINYQELLNNMEKLGFECLETELFENIYNNSNYTELIDCEKDISFLNRYCVFKKQATQEIKLPIQKIIKTKHSKFDFETIDLHQQNINIYKIASLYDIIDCINCIEYKYYKNMITNIQLDSLDASFVEIQNMFKELNILYKPYFIDDPLDVTEYQIGKTNIYFTYHKHIVEKKSEPCFNELKLDKVTNPLNESIEYNNWYIIMRHDQILFDAQETTQEITRIAQTQNEIIQETTNVEIDEITTKINMVDITIANEIEKVTTTENEIKKVTTTENEIENEIEKVTTTENEITNVPQINKVLEEYLALKTNGTKITVKILKDFLQQLNLKVSGKREELQKRLEECVINNNTNLV